MIIRISNIGQKWLIFRLLKFLMWLLKSLVSLSSVIDQMSIHGINKQGVVIEGQTALSKLF